MRSNPISILNFFSIHRLEALTVGRSDETEDYRIAMRATKTAAFHYAIPKFDRTRTTRSIGNIPPDKMDSKHQLQSVVSAVFVVPTNPSSVRSLLCFVDTPGSVPLEESALALPELISCRKCVEWRPHTLSRNFPKLLGKRSGLVRQPIEGRF